MKKQIISIVLVLTLLVGIIPLTASAQEPQMVYITASDDSAFVMDPAGEPLANRGIALSDLEEIDLSNYGLEDYFYDSDMNGVADITALHLFIYVHEVVMGLDWSDVTVTGSAGSIYFADGLFGYSDENLRYDLNGSYPNVDGWGTTADQIVLKDGDFFSVAHYSSWAFWGDSATGFHYFADSDGDITFAYDAAVNEPFDIKVIRSFSDWSNGGLPAFEDEPNFTVYYGTAYGEIAGSTDTDDCGNASITLPSAGKWYLWTEGGYGAEYYTDIVSAPAFGTVNVIAQETEENKLTFASVPGLSFQDYIGMQVMFKNTNAAEFDSFYAEITQIDFEGNATTIQSAGVPYGSSYTVFEQQILSWSMTEQVTMTLYGVKDGVAYEGQSFTTSVEALALAKIPGYVADGDMARAKALVDMLNFGAAVQTAYAHNENDLPNKDLGELAQYGTQEEPTLTNNNVITGTNTIKVYVDNISMQSKVEFQFMVKTTALNGKTVVAMMGDEPATVTYEPYNSYTIIRVACGAAFMREGFIIYITDANGVQQTATYNVTVEGYAAQQLENADKAPAMIALLTYGDAVAAI